MFGVQVGVGRVGVVQGCTVLYSILGWGWWYGTRLNQNQCCNISWSVKNDSVNIQKVEKTSKETLIQF